MESVRRKPPLPKMLLLKTLRPLVKMGPKRARSSSIEKRNRKRRRRRRS
jgi:hypothetical protein